MASKYIPKIRGLYTYPSEISGVPEGSFDILKNTVINRDNVLESRRGNKTLEISTGEGTADVVQSFFQYKNTQLLHYPSGLYRRSGTSLTKYDDANVSFTKPSGAVRSASVLSNENFYITTDSGILKLANVNGEFRMAGIPDAIPAEASIAPALTGSVLKTGESASYRILWGYTDANSNLILGPPSDNVIQSNANANTKDVLLNITIPSEITTGYFYQVYRSFATTTVPTDELFLIEEASPTASQIMAGTLDFTDTTPDSLVGAILYTSPTQGAGIISSNTRPPKAQDVALFQGHTIYANTTSVHRLTVTLLGTGGSNVNIGSTITINSLTYTGIDSSGTPTTSQFRVYNLGTSDDNRNTAEDLVRQINKRNASIASGVVAIYAAGAKLPGTFFLSKKVIDAVGFTVTSDAPNAFDPPLPTGTPVQAQQDRFENGIYISKPDQPEAVPITNFIKIGSANEPIERIIALRDSLFILTTGGIYQMTGTSFSNFFVDELDLTAKVIAPQSVVALNNQVWCLSDQGIIAITESGVEIKSRQIEDIIVKLFTSPATLRNSAFSISYESYRKLIYFFPQNPGDTTALSAALYDTITEVWTEWDIAATSGGIFDDKLYLSPIITNEITEELKSGTFRDYVDGGESNTITNLLVANGSTTFTPSVISDWAVNGVATIDGNNAFFIVSDVNVSTTTVTIEGEIPAMTSSIRTWRPIDVQIRYNPIDMGNINMLKQFSQMNLSFRRPFFRTIDISVFTDLSRTNEPIPLTGREGFGLWGAFPWGSVPWGGGEITYAPYRLLIPRNKTRGVMIQPQLVAKQGYSNFELAGISIEYRNISSRTGR